MIKNKKPTDDDDMCWTAAASGQLEVLKWLRAEGFPWDENTCEVSASTLNFEVFKWARENGCPCNDASCMRNATLAKIIHAGDRSRLSPCEDNDINILEYLYEEGCLPNNTEFCSNAAATGSLALLKWLRKHGCPWDSKTCEKAKSSNSQLIDWIHSNGCPCRHAT